MLENGLVLEKTRTLERVTKVYSVRHRGNLSELLEKDFPSGKERGM